jgi:hypothetical protein
MLTFLFYFQILKFISDPFEPFQYLTNKILLWYERKYVNTNNLGSINGHLEYLATLENKVRENTINKTSTSIFLPPLVIIFVFVFAYMSVSISTCMYYIDKYAGPNFTMSNVTSTYWDYYYFTIIAMGNGVTNTIYPTSIYGQLFVMAVMLIGIMTMAIFFAVFISFYHTNYHKFIETIMKNIREKKEYYTKAKALITDKNEHAT